MANVESLARYEVTIGPCYSLKKISDSWIFDVIQFNEKTFIANGCFKDLMFSILNDKESYVCLSGEFPYKDDNEKKISSRHSALAYQGILRITPKGKLAFATMSAKILFLYNIHGSRLVKNKKITDSYAEYKLDDTGGGSSYSVAHNGNLPFCYRDLSITESKIYALYSGRSFKEYKLAYSLCQYIYL